MKKENWITIALVGVVSFFGAMFFWALGNSHQSSMDLYEAGVKFGMRVSNELNPVCSATPSWTPTPLRIIRQDTMSAYVMIDGVTVALCLPAQTQVEPSIMLYTEK